MKAPTAFGLLSDRLANAFDPRDILLVSAVVYTAIALSTLRSSSVRRLERVGSHAAAPEMADTVAE